MDRLYEENGTGHTGPMDQALQTESSPIAFARDTKPDLQDMEYWNGIELRIDSYF